MVRDRSHSCKKLGRGYEITRRGAVLRCELRVRTYELRATALNVFVVLSLKIIALLFRLTLWMWHDVVVVMHTLKQNIAHLVVYFILFCIITMKVA